MKKIIGLLLILFSLALLATACASPDENGEPNGTQTPETETEAVPTPEPEPEPELEPTPEPERAPDGAAYTMTVEPMFDRVLGGDINAPTNCSGADIIVLKHGEVGVIDVSGREVIPFGDEGIRSVGDGLFVMTDDFRVVIDASGNEIFSSDEYLIKGGWGDLFVATAGFEAAQDWEEMSWGVIDIDGNEIIPFGRYEVIMAGVDGRFVVNRNYGRGTALIDASGGEIIPFGRYNLIWPAGDAFGISHADGEDFRIQLVDIDGRDVTPLGFDNAYATVFRRVDGRFVAASMEEGWGVIDMEGNVIVPFSRYIGIHLVVGGAAVQCPDTSLWGIIRFN